MKVICDTELMKNQTHAELMTPGARFRAVKTDDGAALFFSLGTDSVFYLTREAGGSKTGWTRLDLSSNLAQFHQGATISARAFDVSQNPQTGNIDVALAINDGVSDHLYVSQGNANTENAWTQGVNWQAVPYDASAKRPNLQIANLYLLQTPAGSINRYFIADVIGDGNLLFRYFIDPDKANFPQYWNQHYLSFDAEAGSVISCLGQWPNDDVAGIYTFGRIGQTPQLQYQRTISSEAGTEARVYEFELPAGASAIATSLDPDGNSHFFVAADKALYFYPPEQQDVPMQLGTQLIDDDFFAGISQLHAATGSANTVVWGINQDNHLAYMHCPAGSESDATAWSRPARILDKVHRIAPYLNVQVDNTVMFAQRGASEAVSAAASMVKFTQDSVTTAWKSRGVPLPTNAINHLVEYESYTTHVRVTDDQNLSVPNAAVTLTAISPLTVYANGSSHTLAPNVPLMLTADITGVLTIVEETDSLSGTCFDISATAPAGVNPVTAPVRPLQKPVDTLRTIKSGKDLAAVMVPNSDGKRTPLLPQKTKSSDAHSAALLLQNLVTAYDSLPPNGAKKEGTKTLLSRDEAIAHVRRAAAAGTIFSLVKESGGLAYYEGEAAAAKLGLLPGATALDPGAFFSALWGDIFAWLKFAWDEVEHFAVTFADGIYTFVIKVGEFLYHVVADTIYAVAKAFEYAFNAIKVAFEDLVKWLGFIFDWGDIVRTHKVLKNMVRTYGQKTIDDLPKFEDAVKSFFNNIDERIAKWDKLPGPTGSVGDNTGRSSVKGQDSPQSHWALHHFKNNLSSSTVSFTPKSGSGGDVLSDLSGALNSELSDFQNAVSELHALFSGKIPGLTLSEIFKAVVGVLATLIVDTLETILIFGIKVLKSFAHGVMDALDTVIEIPIISAIYKLIADDPLTILDLACLIIAIPVTIIYKIKADAAPYPDNALTQNLIAAKTFEEIKNLLVPGGGAGLAGAPEISGEEIKIATLALNVGAFFAAFGVAIVNAAKTSVDGDEPVWPLNLAAASLYLVYVSPNYISALTIPPAWYDPVNDTITGISILKTTVDNITPLAKNQNWSFASPWMEMCINAFWLVPAIANVVDKPSIIDIFSFTGNVLFDVGGILTPFAQQKGKVINEDLFEVIQVLGICYGLCSIGYGIGQLFLAKEAPPGLRG